MTAARGTLTATALAPIPEPTQRPPPAPRHDSRCVVALSRRGRPYGGSVDLDGYHDTMDEAALCRSPGGDVRPKSRSMPCPPATLSASRGCGSADGRPSRCAADARRGSFRARGLVEH